MMRRFALLLPLVGSLAVVSGCSDSGTPMTRWDGGRDANASSDGAGLDVLASDAANSRDGAPDVNVASDASVSDMAVGAADGASVSDVTVGQADGASVSDVAVGAA